ncbi:MAG: radical SAM protein [Proteobacteria bacterium]|nr:radical SAM protein [Pseudomonadota bacterium]
MLENLIHSVHKAFGSSHSDSKMPPYLRGMDFSEEEAKKNPLLHVRLFNGNLCNLHCRYCYTDAPYTGNGDTLRSVEDDDNYRTTSLETKLKMLRLLRNEFGTKTVMINGKGEPTLEPDFEALVGGINDLNMIPFVVTNGTTLMAKQGKLWKMLYENNASIMLKMNSVENRELESWLFGVNVENARYKNIRRIIESPEGKEWVGKFAADRRIALNCVLTKHTAGDDGAPSILKYCRESNVIPWFSWLISDGRADNDMSVPTDLKKPLMQKLEQTDREYGYRYTMTEDMNLGCTPEMNKNFFQITAHGRLFLVTKLGDTDSCRKRIDNSCYDCSGMKDCLVNDNIRRKLEQHDLKVH